MKEQVANLLQQKISFINVRCHCKSKPKAKALDSKKTLSAKALDSKKIDISSRFLQRSSGTLNLSGLYYLNF
jgi:hypothetical protein